MIGMQPNGLVIYTHVIVVLCRNTHAKFRIEFPHRRSIATKNMELPVDSVVACIVYSMIQFLVIRGEELFFIHHQICKNRPVTSAMIDQAVLCLTGLLPFPRKKVF